MASVDVNDLKQGMKLEVDNQPYLVVSSQLVKPGKGQPFARVKIKQLMTGKVLERTYKSGESIDLADVVETSMRMLYVEPSGGAVFMDDESYEQITIPSHQLGESAPWLKEDCLYEITFYKGEPVAVAPPTFMELKITETSPGVRGDTASGRVLKPATLETGAQVQIPIFVDADEVIKIDTRTSEYVGRVK